MAASGGNLLELTAPDCPAALAHVLAWWAELAATRGAGFSGPLAISYGEISVWAHLTGRTVKPHEVALLRAIDDAFLRTVSNNG